MYSDISCQHDGCVFIVVVLFCLHLQLCLWLLQLCLLYIGILIFSALRLLVLWRLRFNSCWLGNSIASTREETVEYLLCYYSLYMMQVTKNQYFLEQL